jgi:hypothetical protein
MTRGRCGSLNLHRKGLAPSTSCRSPGAPVHPNKSYGVWVGVCAGVRMIEPYSLRRTGAGDILLFAVRADDAQSRSYRLDRIRGTGVTDRAFTPRYVVELTPIELGSIPPLSRSSGGPRGFARSSHVVRPRRISRASRPKIGPTYVYQCSCCQKKFNRSKPDPKLSPHKTPDGWPCPGRVGYLVETKY